MTHQRNRLLQITASFSLFAYRFDKHHIPYILLAVKDLISAQDSILFNEIFLKKVRCSVIFEKPSKKERKKYKSFLGKISIKSEVKVNSSGYKPQLFRTKKEFWGYMQSELGLEYFLEVKRLIMLSNIAFPGTMHPGEIKVISNYKGSKTKFDESWKVYSLHREMLDSASKLGWPPLKTVPLTKVLRWFYENKMSFKKISNSAISRAFNAYSQLFGENLDDNFQIIWSLLALEVIYCNQNNGANWQITTRAQKFLGNIAPEKVKQLEAIYKFRSKFIHGEVDIPPADFDISDVSPFDEKLYDATVICIAILTATLQEIILRKINQLPLL